MARRAKSTSKSLGKKDISPYRVYVWADLRRFWGKCEKPGVPEYLRPYIEQRRMNLDE